MTKEEKIQMLTGATAAVIDAKTERFLHFYQIAAHQAHAVVCWGRMGVSASGNFWFLNGSERYVFADKNLAAIAEA